jgi:EAL domain-containing protein (putative c-di-GMP-specific phosphodiesterase class I)/PleD family two-component response regulator
MKAKDSNRLLVVDQLPEHAEQINSLLRNSGIIVHIIFAETTAEAEKLIKSDPPFLVIYNDTATKSAPVTKILHLSEKYKLTTCVRFSPVEPTVLQEALDFYSCIAINRDADDQLVKLVKNLLDHSSTRLGFDELETRLDELQSRYNLLLDSSRESIAYVHEGLHVYANRAYLQLLQLDTLESIESVSLLEIMSSDEIDLKKLLRELNKGTFPAEATRVSFTSSSDTSFQAELVFSPARYDGEDCIQMMVQEVDPNAALKSELVRLRQTDPVTKLAGDEAVAVVYLVADNAEELRPMLGVSGWDSFMITFATVIRACIGEDDLAARFDDNGFVLLLMRDTKKSLQSVIRELITRAKNDISEIDGLKISVTCSAGIAMLGSLESTANDAIDHARSAFAQATENGNELVIYKPQLAVAEPDKQDKQWVERIIYALENHELYSVQHAIVNLEGDSEGLFENKTYLREEGNDIQADDFFPIAERNDLGANIDRHVIKGLMTAIAGTGDRHIINLSANSILDFSFPSWLSHLLEELQVQGSQVILQLSSSSAGANIKSSKRMIDELRSAGCSISLSSFDDQERTLKLLDQLDISLVKLIPELTRDLANNPQNQDLVRTVVHATEAKQINIIADNIQDSADLAVLWQCGVKLVSGDFLNETPQTKA